MIWYAAYGSNLLEERFLAYLRGGTVSGSSKVESGARNSDDPMAAVPYMVPRRLGFGYKSTRWNGGGVCFVDPALPADGHDTYGRAWLITVEQLEDVWAQENGDQAGPSIDIDDLITAGFVHRDRNYGRVELLGHLDGHPIATITCNTLPELNGADISYLQIVGRGLMETWNLDPDETAKYLANCPGNRGVISTADLLAGLTEG